MKPKRIKEAHGPEILAVVGPGQVGVGIRAIGINPVASCLLSGQRGSPPEWPFTPGFAVASLGMSLLNVSPAACGKILLRP